MALLGSSSVESYFLRMEVQIHHFLHIRQTDFIRGHFEVWIPTVTVALVLWCLLRFALHAASGRKPVAPVAGILTILLPAVFWEFFSLHGGWELGWLAKGAAVEVPVAVAVALLVVVGARMPPAWLTLILFAAHYLYWYFSGVAIFDSSSYLGPVAPVLGFASAATWLVYTERECAHGAN